MLFDFPTRKRVIRRAHSKTAWSGANLMMVVSGYHNGIVQSHVFRAVIEADRFEDGNLAYHAFCPALKGCHTWGHSPEEALANLHEAAALYVDDLIEAGDAIPDDPQHGTIVISTPAVLVNH